MPEPKGDIPLTGDPRVDAALQRIRGKFRDLEDAMLVQEYLEERQIERNREHAEWMAHFEVRIKEHSEWMKHFEDKLDALADMLMRREGGPEAR